MKKQTHLIDSVESQKGLIKIIYALPVDGSVDVTIQSVTKRRTASQNAFMWGDGLVASIAEQAWINKRQFDSSTWHFHLKGLFLPEGHEEDFELMVNKSYRKWKDGIDGNRILVGSTTNLTTFGMNYYTKRIEVYAAQELGVMLPTLGL